MSKIISQENIKAFNQIVPNGIFENVDLSKISRWKIGGIADCIVRPKSTEETAFFLEYLNEYEIPFLVIGSTSNLLFSDEGLSAVCIQIGDKMSEYKINEKTVWVQAGKWVPSLARNVAQAGLSGIEHTVGIPGTLGGLICMNGGSQRKGIGSHIKTVTAVLPSGKIKKFYQRECKFEYRSSIFQENNYIITEAELEFSKQNNYKIILNEMLEILKSRREKFPQKLPNCGSTFISNPDIYVKFGPPGKIIEDLGFKGYRVGGAEISKVHANFINNCGGAKAIDVIRIINKIKKNVYEKTTFEMKSEVKFVDRLGNIKRADLVQLK